jgi:hypothetical protein
MVPSCAAHSTSGFAAVRSPGWDIDWRAGSITLCHTKGCRARRRRPHWGLSRSFLALRLLSAGLDTGRLLTSCFLPLRLQLGGCLSRGCDLVGGLQVGDGQFNDLSGRRVGGPFGARERSRSIRSGRGVLRWLGFCRWPGRWNDC